MKHITTFLFFIFIGSNQILFSQKIEAKLEIKWKDKELFVKGFCGKTKVPYLVLNYINTSNDSLYFYEAIDSDMVDDYYHLLMYYPVLIHSGDYSLPLCDSIGIRSIGFREPENEYNVFIGKVPGIEWWGWLVTYKQTDKVPFSYDLPELDVTYKLNKTARRLTNQEFYVTQKDSTAQLCDFCYPDKHYVGDTIFYMSYEKMDSILQSNQKHFDSLAIPELASIIHKRRYDSQINYIQSNFITIPPYGIYTKEYDLTHFKIVGGTYNFIYSPHQTEISFRFMRPDLVDIPLKNPDDYENNYVTYHFPEKYNGYKLYSGKIEETMVKIEID